MILALKFSFFYFRQIPLYYRLMILPNSVQVKVIENTNDFFSKKDPVMRSISSCKIRIKSTNSLGNDKHCTLRVLILQGSLDYQQ